MGRIVAEDKDNKNFVGVTIAQATDQKRLRVLLGSISKKQLLNKSTEEADETRLGNKEDYEQWVKCLAEFRDNYLNNYGSQKKESTSGKEEAAEASKEGDKSSPRKVSLLRKKTDDSKKEEVKVKVSEEGDKSNSRKVSLLRKKTDDSKKEEIE